MGNLEHAALACPRCGLETQHELAYAGRLLVVTTCTRCGHTIERDVRARYLADLRQRLVSKPRRMLRRFRKHPLGFASSLPRTVSAKPLELISEVKLVWRARHGK
jgi:PHP family Zn ribbon phosphoesterase